MWSDQPELIRSRDYIRRVAAVEVNETLGCILFMGMQLVSSKVGWKNTGQHFNESTVVLRNRVYLFNMN